VTVEGTTQKGKPVKFTAVTGEDGAFSFGGLPPGVYALSRRHAGSYSAGKALPGTVNGTAVGQPVEGEVRAIVLAAGAFGLNYRFAEVRSCGLTGMVSAEDDLDEDGPQETALEGVTLILSGTDDGGRAVQLTARTDVRGQYRFKDLFPGTYDLFAAPMKGWAAKSARAGDKGGRSAGAGKLSGVALRSGDLGSRYNFKMHGTASVAGRAWDGEVPAADAEVHLQGEDEAGNEVRRVVRADGAGSYRFVSLRAGVYQVEGTEPLDVAAGAAVTGCDVARGG
ncbi:MAG: MSCRAMM family protein, partial [Gemmataceae bacterium]